MAAKSAPPQFFMSNGVPEVNRGQRALAAIVLTDAVGFSARMSVDEELTLNLIHRDQQLMRQLCQQFEGQVLKSTGDGLLMYFVSAAQAVMCSLAIQQELTRISADIGADKRLLHRIGIHLGDVFFSQSDVMGNGVNIAARLQTEAHPGGVCISQVVYDVVKSRLSLNATFAGPLKLKNIQEPVPAFHLHLDAAAAKAAPTAHPTLAPPTRQVLAPGTRVGGRYGVQRVLGQGGFGRSYLVEDAQRFGELCVLKEFFPANKSGKSLQKALDLFKREAKTLYQINHPQVPKFLACFTQAQRLFIVQEYIDGVTYSHLLRQRKQQGQRFSEAEIIRWLMQMLQVLDHLHSLKIVHRDISPDNIMYSRDRNLPILIDFGLVNNAMSELLSEDAADSEDDPEDEASDTLEPNKPATMVGKFGYSPPEQMHLGQCYPCSDLYALGVTAIVLLTGKYPRDLMDRESLEWQWPSHVTLNASLADILHRLIRPKPKERYQSAWEVMQVLGPLTAHASPLPKELTYQPPPKGNGAAFEADRMGAGLGGESSLSQALQNPAFIERCRQELTRCIGPIASVVLEEVLDQHPDVTPEELVAILAAQLSDGKQATEFTSRIQEPGFAKPAGSEVYPDGARRSGTSGAGISGTGISGAGGSGSSAPPEPSLTPEFLQRCRQALTQCIGPMAEFVMAETLADYPALGSQEFIEQLCAEIPDSRKVVEFRRKMAE